MSESCGNPVSEAGRSPHAYYPPFGITIFVIEWKLRRGALKPSGSLLVGFSGGLGSTVLLDLVHKIYCAKSEGEELKGGKEHPRRNRCVCRCVRSRLVAKGLRRAQVSVSQTQYPRAFDLAGGDAKSVAALRAHLLALPTPTGTLATLFTLTRLLLFTAYSIGASHLVLGTFLTSMSISPRLVAQGGGFVVPQTIQEEWIPPFVERVPGDSSWKGEVRLVRPLRDVGMKECQAWVWWLVPTAGGGEAEDSYP
ncbi:hypothetical protein EDB84DRAFT_1444327 [Lactarius hengduanensis]|nr:hypothetical protein EDB84DRAFT_1444327 [Lactarius hengduanensis]